WVTVDEYERFFRWLDLSPNDHVLEIASGSGGPARYLSRATGCRVTGIDASESGVATASPMAADNGESDRVEFQIADANTKLPFAENSFDGLTCIDSMNHFADRLTVFRE